MTTRVCHSKTRGRDPPATGRAAASARLRAQHRRARDDSRLRAAGAPAPARKLAEIAALEREPRAPTAVVEGDPRARHHHHRHLLQARARSRARGQRAQARHDVSAAARDDARIRRAASSRCVVVEEGDPYLADAVARRRHRRRSQAGDVPLWRVKRRPRPPHPGAATPSPEPAAARRQAARAVPGLPAPRRVHRAAQPGLHRGRRYRLLHAGRAAAV